MRSKLVLFCALSSLCLISCIKEHGHWTNDDWDDLPESGYYEWKGNTIFTAATYEPLDSLVFIRTPEQAGFTAGYKFVFQPKALARVEFIIDGKVLMSRYIRTVEKDLIFNYFTLADNSNESICRFRSYSNLKNNVPHNKHFVLLEADGFNGTSTLNFGEGYPFFMKVE
ncbi:MAG: hypothetical protein RL092_1993 [Bacteroidota bacterium]|jgi:hypothetical protein